MNLWNARTHNLGILGLSLWIPTFKLFQCNPCKQSLNYIIRRKVVVFIFKFKPCECNESKESMWSKVNSICTNTPALFSWCKWFVHEVFMTLSFHFNPHLKTYTHLFFVLKYMELTNVSPKFFFPSSFFHCCHFEGFTFDN